ncbi:MAG: hypothetical protein PUD16_13690 [bacterium]|nr:hypothetical protein [bacterium]
MHRESILLENALLSSDERAWYRGERCWNCDPIPRRRILGIKIRK